MKNRKVKTERKLGKGLADKDLENISGGVVIAKAVGSTGANLGATQATTSTVSVAGARRKTL